MAKANPKLEEALEHERALYAERVQEIRRHRKTKTRGAMDVVLNPVSADDESQYCRELAIARCETRIATLAVVPELGSDENLDILIAEIEKTVHVHYAAIVDEIKRQHLAAGRPGTLFEAQRARLERQAKSTASEAVATAKRRLKLAQNARSFGLPAGIGTAISASPKPPLADQPMHHFDFVQDPALQSLLERDYQEIERAMKAQCWKSVIILSGGAIEALLLSLLQKHSTVAVKSAVGPPSRDLSRWSLKDLISVAVDCKLVGASVEKLSDPVREFRNLIHPGNEVRSKLKFGAEEARIAFEVLNIVVRELA